MKDVDGFLFKKKLPTTKCGIANLDGFMEEDSGQIYTIYDQTCNECLSVNFKALFEVIVNYLQSVKNIGKNKTDIVNAVDFKLCDQRNINI